MPVATSSMSPPRVRITSRAITSPRPVPPALAEPAKGAHEAVNLTYDLDRKAVVAIYGTVRDFRPFVDAFYRGYVLKN